MEILKDSKGASYVDVGNIRISYIEQKNRSNLKDWPNADVIRIQAYTGKGKSLHQGAEYPINNEKDVYHLFEAFSKLMIDK
ncbi:hypothetical protein [Flavobacterium sp. LS1R10]|uniref:hypothetical protein n=1 Tax=Flavobacterium sp. LS1R10 TaxID=2497482 RepID=UPI000F81C75F|nr:hypothetical protein [Flavobacterium sp. LS1R10]RTY76281.1 hypothetical protein EKL96_01970 [Flavobacterium sp. LS1R10]